MWSRCARALLGLLVASWVALPATRAFAELGGDLKSVERDRAKMKAAITVRPMSRYTVHEMTGDSGATVREFATLEGKVFAVAWRGPFHPDYQQVLGAYFEQLQQATKQAVQQKRGRRAPVTIETPGFVFQSFGHVHDMAGRAYVPQMLPAGVGVEQIQ